jgi:hypothetical protein
MDGEPDNCGDSRVYSVISGLNIALNAKNALNKHNLVYRSLGFSAINDSNAFGLLHSATLRYKHLHTECRLW